MRELKDLDEWDSLLAKLPGAHPYHTLTWGRTVASIFGGDFTVIELEDGAGKTYLPIIDGGEFGHDGFVSGHIGYGGSFDATTGIRSAREQVETVLRVETLLGRRCQRVVTTPSSLLENMDHSRISFESKTTLILNLSDGEERVWARHAGSVRTAIRKAAAIGLIARPLEPADFTDALQLVQETQTRVGASYRVHPDLMKSLINAYPFCLAMGCWLDRQLVSAGFFLRFAGRAAYLFNGWSHEHGQLGPNYSMLDAAIKRLIQLGDISLDLGFSHNPDLFKSKLRWGATESHYVVGLRKSG